MLLLLSCLEASHVQTIPASHVQSFFHTEKGWADFVSKSADSFRKYHWLLICHCILLLYFITHLPLHLIVVFYYSFAIASYCCILLLICHCILLLYFITHLPLHLIVVFYYSFAIASYCCILLLICHCILLLYFLWSCLSLRMLLLDLSIFSVFILTLLILLSVTHNSFLLLA